MNYTINKKTNTRTTFRNTTSQNTNYRSIRTKRKIGSSIDPARLVKKAIITEEVKFIPVQAFQQLPLNDKLKANLAGKGFVNPTKIQEETLEHLISGRDLLGVANTGTGKTGAFLIPVIEQLLNSSEKFKTLVVVPTRELALQIEEEFKSLTKGMGIYASSFIGGTNLGRDFVQLKRNNQLIIGTPGRLMDLSNRGALKLNEISVLIIDEFDRMLDMGFVDDIKEMVSSMKTRKQTMLFSATVDKTQKSLINELLNNPLEVKVNMNTTTSDQVEQDIIKVPRGGDKFTMLLNLFDNQEFAKVLIFAETKRLVDNVNQRLNQSGVKSDLIHGDKTQNYRNNALNSFKRGKVKVLVATDVAARGIDVSDVTHVINYELPMSFDSYVHRIGRTGRAGKKGKALTFVD